MTFLDYLGCVALGATGLVFLYVWQTTGHPMHKWTKKASSAAATGQGLAARPVDPIQELFVPRDYVQWGKKDRQLGKAACIWVWESTPWMQKHWRLTNIAD